MESQSQPRISLVLDPRFSGGTSTAVAREILELSREFDLKVIGYSSSMFRGDHVHSAIAEACYLTGTDLTWDPDTISCENVVVHNPSFLKFDDTFPCRIYCERLIVVCHENFERPSGAQGFDVDHCLRLLRDSTLARQRILAPISVWNRVGVEKWASHSKIIWEVAPENWTNICSFELVPPTKKPRDRRGRHSRPGFEKFPDLGTLRTLFPVSCEAVRILGADSLMNEQNPDHWDLIPFCGEPVDDFLRSIDFFVYFTNPSWRESFGRVIAEAIAAGKLVITDKTTARTFGEGVIGALPHEVDDIVRAHVDDPERYEQRVLKAQESLSHYSGEAFLSRVTEILQTPEIKKNKAKSRLEAIHDFV